MDLKHILAGLASNEIKELNEAMKICLVNYSLVYQNDDITEKLIALLSHENYKLRLETEKILIFLMKYSTNYRKKLIELLAKDFETIEKDQDIIYHYSKLTAFVSEQARFYPQLLIKFLTTKGITQGLTVFILRDLFKNYPNIIENFIEKIPLNSEENPNKHDFLLNESEGNDDIKIAFCWLFWKNPKLLNPRVINTLISWVDDINPEIREFSCEILKSLFHDKIYHDQIYGIFKRKINDNSWRVQKFVLDSLFNIKPNLINDQEIFNSILGLFWHPDWIIRRNACEFIPSRVKLDYNSETKIIIELLIASLNDPRWEVRERAAISCNRYMDLNKKEFQGVLEKILEQTNDLHEEVRKTSCLIISENINNFGTNSEYVFRKIIWLLEDENILVRRTSLKMISSVFTQTFLARYFKKILDSLQNLLIDPHPSVSNESWESLVKIFVKRSEKQKKQIFSIITNLMLNSDPEVRFNACNASKNIISSKLTLKMLENDEIYEIWKTNIIHLLEDDNPKVLESAWGLVITKKEIFLNYKTDLINIIKKINSNNSLLMKFACEACSEFKWIQDDDFIRNKFLNELSNTKDRELKKTILRSFLVYDEYSFIENKIIINLIKEGQWDVQKFVTSFLISNFLKEEDKVETKELQAIILDIIENPISRYRSHSPNSIIPFDDILKSIEDEISEEKIINLFEDSNDDLRFENWIKLEENLDYLNKINHPKQDEFISIFRGRIFDPNKNYGKKLGFYEILSSQIDNNTPLKIISLMLKQQESVRANLLNEIERKINFKNFKNKTIINAIVNTLNDTSLMVRNISWNILQNKIINYTDFENIQDTVLSLTRSHNVDTRARALTILIAHSSYKKPGNDIIFNRIFELLTDSSIIVRNQVWYLLKDQINLKLPRYQKYAREILKFLSNQEDIIRDEVNSYIERNLDIFLPIIEKYPQHANVYHLLGIIYCKQKKFEKGIQLFLSNLERNPSDINSRLAISLAYLAQKKFDDSIKWLEEARTIDPVDFRIYDIWSELMSEKEDEIESKKFNEISNILRNFKNHLQ